MIVSDKIVYGMLLEPKFDPEHPIKSAVTNFVTGTGEVVLGWSGVIHPILAPRVVVLGLQNLSTGMLHTHGALAKEERLDWVVSAIKTVSRMIP